MTADATAGVDDDAGQLVSLLREIDREDMSLIEHLAEALSDKHTAETLVLGRPRVTLEVGFG
ncbi:hypothetical protein [Streptomyces sp. NPDC056105]|uniref:hypothetical protein n=1 Tax=Streptomyces sp. NPDC056105 TaxID=3345714 RepID=UPI0035DDD76D